jgi:O-antigen/teichoic acid export membrane protein
MSIKYDQNDFLKNVIKLVSGALFAQAITISFAPILSRTFSPESFGIFASYLSIVSIISIFVTMRYENAILQPKNDERAESLILLSILAAVFFSFIFFLVILFFHEKVISSFVTLKLTKESLYLAPLGVFITAISSISTQLFIRKREYANINRLRIYQAGGASFFALFFGFFYSLEIGLIVGHTLGLIAGVFLSVYPFLPKLKSRLQLLLVLKKYRNYAFLDMPSSMLNVFANALPVMSISFLMGPYYGGLYFMVERILKAPIGMISSSIGSVFREQAVNKKRQHGEYRLIFISTLKKLLLFGFPVFLFIFLTAPFLFKLFLGDKWSEAGEFAKILTPMFFMGFISSPLSFSFYVSNKLKYDFFGQLFFTLGILASIVFGYYLESIVVSLIGISLVGTTVYSLYLIISYNLSK